MKELSTYWKVTKGAVFALFVATAAITVAKIVVTYCNWVWNLW